MTTFPSGNLTTPLSLGSAQTLSSPSYSNFAPATPPPPVQNPSSPYKAPTTTSTTPPAPTTPTPPPPAPTTTPTPLTDTTSPSTDTTQQDQLKQLQDERTKEAQDFYDKGVAVSNTITNLQNGTIPLTPGEQAQVDGLKSQWQTLLDQQTQANKNFTTGTQILAARSGVMQYAPGRYLGDVQKAISDGVNKVSDLMVKEASAVAALTQSLKDNDIKAVKDAFTAYQDASKTRQDALNSTIKDTQDAIKAAADAAAKQQDYELNVAKFQETQSQDAFDQAFKIEQQKFAESQLAETKRHNQAQEGIDAFKAGQGAGGGGIGQNLSSATLSETGNPDPAAQQQVLGQIAQQYGPMTATAVKALANYEMNPADWKAGATKGMTRDQAVTLAKMYDPTYNEANYTVRATYLKNLASSQTGTVGSAINSANKSINHLTAFVTSMQTLPNGPVGFLNGFDNAMTLNQGQRENITRAQTEGLGVAEELAKFFKGSGTVDVASIDAWKSQLSTNASPASVRGLTQGAVDLLSGQLQTLAEQYQSTMGKAPQTDFLNPSARASLSNLKNQGYKIDIPGIGYTDVKAFQKNDPDATQKMQSAFQLLQSAGLPTTPDNILQAAQL